MAGCRIHDQSKLRNYYRYYDTPDGHDILQKAMVTTRYGLITGMILGTYDVMMYSHAVGLSPVVKRYLMHVAPLGLMGATFAVVSNGMLHARQRDDSLNYFLGGFACGPILAAYLGSGHAVLLGGLLLGIIAKIKKDAVDSCTSLIPCFPHHRGTIRGWRSDYSWVKDPRDEMRHTCDESK